ncbi:MAG: ribonuclease [Bacteroidota bacterium]|jgi:ribonuclease-3
MGIVPNAILQFFSKDANLAALKNILGFTPRNLSIYEQALVHRSSNSEVEQNNERLEFLGDAVLGSIVGEYLYKKYPAQGEGFLTDMRSKIVNRVTLNDIALRIGLKQIVKYNKSDVFLRKSQIFGNALEALIGAVYQDRGYIVTKKFIQTRIIAVFVDLDALEQEEANLKNKLIGWANKNKHNISFDLLEEKLEGKKRFFTIGIALDQQIVSSAVASSKKEASKRAAKSAIEVLGI